MKMVKRVFSAIEWLGMAFLICVGAHSIGKTIGEFVGFYAEDPIPAIISDAVDLCNMESDSRYLSIGEAVFELQKHLLNSDTDFEIRFESDSGLDFTNREVYREYFYNPVFSEENSGGNPFAGAYLKQRVIGGTIRIKTPDKKHYTFCFENYRYINSAEEEELFERRVSEVINELGLTDETYDGVKILAVYQYVTSHVTYDHELRAAALDDTVTGREHGFSAYGALMDGTAVCGGYAGLFQVLAKASGVEDVCVVTGYGEGKDGWQGHAWNLVRLGDCYYQLDPTGDAGQQITEYRFFLQGWYIRGHVMDGEFLTKEFLDSHPIAELPFGY